MFSWECSKCGHDNPPSAKTCIYCGNDDTQPQAQAPAVPPPATEEFVATPPAAEPPAAEPWRPAPSPYRTPDPVPHRTGMPTWLMSVLFAAGFLVLGVGVYYTIQYFSNRPTAAARSAVNNAVASRNKVSNPLQKYIEVIGIRLLQDGKRQLQARFVVVNHAASEISDIQANVTLWASTAKSEEDPAGTFSFKIPRLGPNESKELSAPFSTKLKIYELPDWQNLTADLQINAQ